MKKTASIPVLTAVLVALLAQAPVFAQSAAISEAGLQPLGGEVAVSSVSPIQPDPSAASAIDAGQHGLIAQTAASPKLIPIEPPAVVVDQPATEILFKLLLNKTRPLEVDGAVRDIIIGNSGITDVVVRSPTQIYLVGKAIGSTNVFLMNEAGAVLRQIDVQVEPDGAGVEQAFRTMLPDENLRASSVGDSIVISGSASSDGVAAQAQQIARRFVTADDRIINMMTVGHEQQVLLRVRIAELSKSAVKDMSAAYVLLDPANIGGAAINFLAGPFGAAAGGIVSILNPNDYAATFSWLETQGLAKILAEPNLLAVSGENAAFLAGGEFPIPVAQEEGAITVEFRTFGVSLAFQPVVLSSGSISLKIQTEVSQISAANSVGIDVGDATIVVPSLTVRSAQSTIELPSGGSIMIAGLLQQDIGQTLVGIPGLMNVPILGALFRSPHFQRQETELVIIVSAFLAKSVNPSDLVLPTDGFAPSHDLDRYFIGRLQNIYVKKPASGPGAPSLQGPIGYIID